ncbi:MAG: hypothetical protein GY820_32295 [Gammaproteobacteria bacterium]|nr:hypothetical protein [Gammaproteobacteria bacterium]
MKLDNNTSPYIGKDAQIYDGSWGYNYYAHAELKDKSSYLKNVSKELDQENGNFENIRQIHSSSLSSKIYDGSYTGRYPLQIHLQPPFNCALQMIHL